ncbi:CHY zinc finger protein [Halostella litorea]|uniref:CHY zinc finger protein n=1 Tax=Halostella litorea TaxID=2528831 RepID=UPI0010932E8D|nr:CHY zinc finger protein [Halostella litorea]
MTDDGDDGDDGDAADPAGVTVDVAGRAVRGVGVGSETRCAHYGGPRDVVAIRFACCDAYYPCFRCHAAVADHDAERVPRAAFDAAGVLCGVCGATLSVRAFVEGDHACPDCGAAFNPGCADHYDRYFEMGG